jgi:hypothetical protein
MGVVAIKKGHIINLPLGRRPGILLVFCPMCIRLRFEIRALYKISQTKINHILEAWTKQTPGIAGT